MGKKNKNKSNINDVLKVIHGAEKKQKKHSKKDFDNDINAMLGYDTGKKKKHKDDTNDVEDILMNAVAQCVEIIGGEPADTLGIIIENMNDVMEVYINEYLIGETVSDNSGIHTPAIIKDCSLEPMSAALLLSDNRQVDLSEVSHAEVKFAESSSAPKDFDQFIRQIEHPDEVVEDKEEEDPNVPFSNEEVSDYLDEDDSEDSLEAVVNADGEPKVVEKPREEVAEEVVTDDEDTVEKVEIEDVVIDSDELKEVPKAQLSSAYGKTHESVDLGSVPVLKKNAEEKPDTAEKVFTKNRKDKPL